ENCRRGGSAIGPARRRPVLYLRPAGPCPARGGRGGGPRFAGAPGAAVPFLRRASAQAFRTNVPPCTAATGGDEGLALRGAPRQLAAWGGSCSRSPARHQDCSL